jgi:hypothetical protein
MVWKNPEPINPPGKAAIKEEANKNITNEELIDSCDYLAELERRRREARNVCDVG